MSDRKISELTALTVPDNADIFPVVDISTNETKKITFLSLFNQIFADFGLGVLAFLDTIGTSLIDNNAVTTVKIADDNVTNAKLANMAESTIKGRATGAGTGDPTDLTATQIRTLLNVIEGANMFGAASSTDNAIPRFDGTSGKTLQNSGVVISDNGEILLVAGGVADAPLKFQSGTNLTTAEDGAIEFDGTLFYGTSDDGNRGLIPLKHFIMLNADYALTNSNTVQKAFNATTNGALTLEAGRYFFRALFYITGMAATSGNAEFSLGGTSTVSKMTFHSRGHDLSSVLTDAAQNGAGHSPASGASGTRLSTSATGTQLFVTLEGHFNVTVAGTVIPSIRLESASGATMKDGSFFECYRIGAAGATNVGDWS